MVGAEFPGEQEQAATGEKDYERVAQESTNR